MYNIKMLNKIDKQGLEVFDNNYVIGDNVENPDAILVRSFNMHEYTFCDNLLAIARAGAGVNNIPISICTEKSIVVFNTPGANANAVKELVLSALLLSARKIVEGITWANTLKSDVAKMVESGKSQFIGPEIEGKTIGVVGLGAIGVMVANAVNSLGMTVIGYDPYISIENAWHLSRNIKRSVSIDEIFEKCDYISLHIPLTEKTKGIINPDTIKKLKKNVRILNFSRGELVDSDSIIQAVNSGKVAKYITDFPNEKLLGIENIITIPHLGASTPESEQKCAVMACNQIKDFLETGNITNSVNFADVSMPYTGLTRITIVHKNIPNMLGQITAAIAKEGVNIENMLSKGKDNIAYVMIDTSSQVSLDAIDAIKGIDGVLRVRII